MLLERTLDIFVPSWWEIKVTVAASVFVIVAYWFFTYRSGDVDGDEALVDGNSPKSGDTDEDKVNSFQFLRSFCSACEYQWS